MAGSPRPSRSSTGRTCSWPTPTRRRTTLLDKQPKGAPFAMREGVRDALAKVDARNIAGVPRPPVTTGALPTTFIGSPDTLVEQVRRCRDEVGAGVLDLSLAPPGFGNADLLMRSLDLFGKKVLPRIRDI